MGPERGLVLALELGRGLELSAKRIQALPGWVSPFDTTWKIRSWA
jgi:hypothetical protein